MTLIASLYALKALVASGTEPEFSMYLLTAENSPERNKANRNIICVKPDFPDGKSPFYVASGRSRRNGGRRTNQDRRRSAADGR